MSIVATFTKFFEYSDKELNTVEALTSSVEIATHLVIESRIAEAIPVLGLVVKAFKARASLSDHLLARKLSGFLEGTGELSAKERQIAAEMFSDDKRAQMSGEKLVMLLDRMTDSHKPVILGKLFKRFTIGLINVDQLRRLAMSVETGYVDDLKDLLHPLQEESLSYEDIQDCRRRLVHTGLTAVHVYQNGSGEILTYFQFTKLGLLFYELVNEHPPSLACDKTFALQNALPLQQIQRSTHRI